MTHDDDRVLLEIFISNDGDVELRTAPLPTRPTDELVFTPLHEGQEPVRRPLSKKLKKWLQKTKPVSLDHAGKVMAPTALPPDPSTITIANQLPQ